VDDDSSTTLTGIMVDSYSYNTRSLSMVMRGAGSRLGELTALFFCEFAVDGKF
jgi:hypothetical protein